MKRYYMWFLVLAAVLTLCCGCSKLNKDPQSAGAPSTVPAESQDAQLSLTPESGSSRSNIVEVATMDEFLAALAPDTEIVLNAGTYVLTDSRDYGVDHNNPYFCWKDTYDGFELVIQDVTGLTIRGNSKDGTCFQAIPRYANVLTFRGCCDILLEDLTLGHTRGIPGECSGGVLYLDGSDEISINRCGFYGCGTIGINAYYSDGITVTDSDIYECSSMGISLMNCRDFIMEGSRIHDLGNPYSAYSAFSINNCKRVVLNNNEITGNDLCCMMTLGDSRKVECTNNQFIGNSVKDFMFSLFDSTVVFEGNTVEGTVRRWYDLYSVNMTDGSGAELTADALNGLYPDCRFAAEPVSAEDLTEVHVSTTDEFLDAIGSNTVIVLDKALYDLSTATGYGYNATDYYYWTDNFDGPALVIHDVHDLTIRSGDGKPKAHTISAVPRYADVLFFRNCINIKLEGFTAGHTKEPGYCMGGVIHFEQCDAMTVDNCRLYGCGTLGVLADYCSGIQVLNSEIYECSYGGIQMHSTQEITIDNCRFRDLGGDRLYFYECSNITENGNSLENGYYN